MDLPSEESRGQWPGSRPTGYSRPFHGAWKRELLETFQCIRIEAGAASGVYNAETAKDYGSGLSVHLNQGPVS